MRHSRFCWAGLILTCCTGCSVIVTQLKDKRDDYAINRTNHYIAARAWSEVKHCYFDLPCRHDFECGFKRGYTDRASGLNGCPPALPPRKYWRAKLMGPEAMNRANAWFDGYRHGVVVAEQDGNADLARVPTSVPPVDRGPEESVEVIQAAPTAIDPEEYLNTPHETAPEPLPSSIHPGESPTETPQTAPQAGAGTLYDEAPPADANSAATISPATEGLSPDPNVPESTTQEPGNPPPVEPPGEIAPPAAEGKVDF